MELTLLTKAYDMLLRNRKYLIVLFIVLLISFLYGLFYSRVNVEYRATKKKLQALELLNKQREAQYQQTLLEKTRIQDSSRLYELAAQKAATRVAELERKVRVEKRAKDSALAKLKNLPVKVIDSILTARYQDVPKSGIDLSVDKNVGNAVVVELVEKDYLVSHVVTIDSLNAALKRQVISLDTSLQLNKKALQLADTALQIKNTQYQESQQSIELLKKDLKATKNKAFWNQWKGVGKGVAVGVLLMLIAK